MADSAFTKWKYLAVIGVLFVSVMAFRIYHDIQRHHAMLEDDINMLAADIQRVLRFSIEEIESRYAAVSALYMNRPSVVEALGRRDRMSLYQLAEQDYLQLKLNNPDLFVMHWFDPQNVTVLRMHKPQSYDDNLTLIRPVVVEVNRERTALSAFEVGKNGVTYRVTFPLYAQSNHRYLGVLEFGIKPSFFTRRIQSNFDVRSEIFVRSESLKNLSYRTDFKEVDGYKLIRQDPFFDDVSHDLNLSAEAEQYRLVKKQGRVYVVFSHFSLPDMSGAPIAKIVVAKDITETIQKNEMSLQMVNLINLVLLLGSLWFIYAVFSRYEQALLRNYRRLKELVQSLEKSRDRHRQAQQIAHVGNWELDHVGGYLYWSDEIYRILGFEPRVMQPSYEAFLLRVHDEDRERLKATFARSQQTGEPYSIIHRIVTPGGTVKFLAEKGLHTYDENGRILKTEGTTQDITQIRRLEDKAYTDELTGLFNRRFIDIAIEKELSQSLRGKTPLSVAICDIDFFKQVNDAYGHDAGDRVLKRLAQIFADHFREGDSVGRWGGEEFVVIMPGIDRHHAMRRLERLRELVEHQNIDVNESASVRITISIGLCSFEGEGAPDATALMKLADEALYRAKAAGRNRVMS